MAICAYLRVRGIWVSAKGAKGGSSLRRIVKYCKIIGGAVCIERPLRKGCGVFFFFYIGGKGDIMRL